MPSTSRVIDAIYTGAVTVEKAAAPVGTAAAYGAFATLNPQLAFVAYGAALVGGLAIIVQQAIQPNMTQAVDQFNQLVLEIILPKPVKPFTGYLYDVSKKLAEQR